MLLSLRAKRGNLKIWICDEVGDCFVALFLVHSGISCGHLTVVQAGRGLGVRNACKRFNPPFLKGILDGSIKVPGIIDVIKFSKMHGLGNDFVVIDAINQKVALTTEQIRFIGDRHFGVGCDQLLLVEPAQSTDADFRYRIFNADGGEVGQCGNGARCFARFVHDHGLSDKPQIPVEVAGGIIQLSLEQNGQVTVEMGQPQFIPAAIPFVAGAARDRYTIEVEETVYELGAVSMGNPHAVLQVASVADAPVAHLGPLLESHARFPERVNVGFMEVVDARHIRLRVFERGAGETLACGSGACAAMVVGHRWGLLDDEVLVDLPGGSLWVRWSGDESTVRMTGPATHVYEGKIEL